MQWEIIYETPNGKDTWKQKPGKLYVPVPKTVDEAAAAVRIILERHKAVKITIAEVKSAPTK